MVVVRSVQWVSSKTREVHCTVSHAPLASAQPALGALMKQTAPWVSGFLVLKMYVITLKSAAQHIFASHSL